MRTLGTSENETLGILTRFWWFAMAYAPDGDLSDFTEDDIAEAVGWESDPATLVQALQNPGPNKSAHGFLDGMNVHDWNDYGGKLHRKREADAQRKREGREKDKENPSGGHPTDVFGTAHVEERRGEEIEERKDLAAKTAAAKPGSTEIGKPAQRIVAHYVDCHERQGRTKPDGRLIGKLAKAAKERLDAGASERTVMAAVELLVEKAFDPTTLANFVSQVEREGWKPDPAAEAAYLSQRIAGVGR
jgi:hypothetical protein